MGIVRRWSPDEDEKLRELARAGKNALEISNELTRSASAVRRRDKSRCRNQRGSLDRSHPVNLPSSR